MLTSFIELEGYKACIYTNRNGPHTCHCFHKRCLLFMDVHITSVIGSRKLRLVFARFILLKVKGEGPDYNLLPGEWVQDSLQFNDLQIKFVVKPPRKWSAIGCFEIEELAGVSIQWDTLGLPVHEKCFPLEKSVLYTKWCVILHVVQK